MNVLPDVHVELRPALAKERSGFVQDDRLCLRPLPVREEVRGGLPRDHALQAGITLEDGAEVDAVAQRIIARQLELVQERNVELPLVAEAAAFRNRAPLVQVRRRRSVRI